MRWDALFADLEAQAVAIEHAERAGEIEERTRGELATIGLVDRLRAAMGTTVRLRLAGSSAGGTVRRVGPDWLLLEDDSHEVVVAMGAILSVRGLSRHSAVPGSAGVVASRLGLRSALRGIARDRSAVRLDLRDGTALDATIDRVGADFVDVATHPAGEARRRPEVRDVELIPLAAISALRRSV